MLGRTRSEPPRAEQISFLNKADYLLLIVSIYFRAVEIDGGKECEQGLRSRDQHHIRGARR